MYSANSKWETDAGNISNYAKFDKFVYRNSSVDNFLEYDDIFFVIATKGIGKTLLLSYKRYLLENRYTPDGYSSSILFIPKGQSYISFIESIKTTLSVQYINKFKDWEYCKKFWVLVIELTALSYTDNYREQLIEALPPRAQRHKKVLLNLVSAPKSVEYIFNELISMNESTLTQLERDISNSVSLAFSNINRSMTMFFDRLDNALETAHDSIWISLQIGLLEAAWDIMRSCKHIKIYLSIRQEAYSEYQSRNANAGFTAAGEIKYTKAELRELVNHLVRYYEGKNTIQEFLGFSTFPNTVIYKDEDVFDYMYRYSIGRPRDFVEFCNELSKEKDSPYNTLDEKRMTLKESVRTISSSIIVKSLYDELRMLLTCLTTHERFDMFLVMLKNNILSYVELQEICRRYNGFSCDRDCEECPQEYHPFCDLYNMGLLGVVRKDIYTGEEKQKFKTPYDYMTKGLRNEVDYFLIHPALREYINKLHRKSAVGNKYELYNGILVGDEVLWSKKDSDLYNVNRLIAEIKDVQTLQFFKGVLKDYIQKTKPRFPYNKYNNTIRKNYPIYEQRIIDSLIDYFTRRKSLIMPKPISIFVSYAVDNANHKMRVESFTDMLRKMGFDAQMDSFLKEQYPDIDAMMTIGLRMDKVLIVLSPEYKRKADNMVGGVWKEFKMIIDDLEVNPHKYIFVSFEQFTPDLKEKISPRRIGNRWIVDLAKGKSEKYNELVAFLKDEKEYPISKVNDSVVAVKPKEIKDFE